MSGSPKHHILIHSGEVPCECQQCYQSFSWSGNLKKQMNIHSGVKPFACKQCAQSFNRSVDLKTHMGRNLTSAISASNHSASLIISRDTSWYTVGETLCLQALSPTFQSVCTYQEPHVDTHWGEALFLQKVSPIFQEEFTPQEPHVNTQWAKALCLQAVFPIV